MGHSLLLISISGITLISVGFCALSVKFLYDYIQAYRFERSHYTLLLGFIHLRLIVLAYVITTLLAAGFFVGFFIYMNA